jgi:nucleotide-binding universal stress UspA family protein
VHLDLKPTNVLFRDGGEAVLVDFGLAHHSHYPDLLAEELRFPVGNWVYMSPEQVLGVRCDPRSDIFALGCMLYQLATGRLPFGQPRSVAELRRRLHSDPIPPRAIVPATPPWLQEIILDCLEVDARRRYASADRLAFDLAAPLKIAVTERGLRARDHGWTKRLYRRYLAPRYVPAPCPPPSAQRAPSPVVVVALAVWRGSEPLFEALRNAARGVMAALPECRFACVTVVPPAAALTGEGDENSATGRHIRRLVELRHWAKPLRLPEERLTYHVLESEKPALALIDFVKINDVDQVLIGAPGSGTQVRSFAGVSAQVVAQVPCSVTVVRPRAEG